MTQNELGFLKLGVDQEKIHKDYAARMREADIHQMQADTAREELKLEQAFQPHKIAQGYISSIGKIVGDAAKVVAMA